MKISYRTCPACDSTWLEGQLYWSDGKIGCPHDLAGLLCNDVKDPDCINPCKGSNSGTTWEHKRYWRDEK